MAEAHFTETDAYVPVKALIIYESGTSNIVTMHDIAKKEGERFALQSGKTVEVKEVIASLEPHKESEERKQKGVWCDRLLYLSEQKMIWFRPAHKRQIIFTAPKLKHLTGKELTMPNTLFCASSKGRLSVFSYAGCYRPLVMSELYHAPYPNIYDNGSLCTGSVKFPDEIHADDYMKWEDLFFESSFSHDQWVDYWTGENTELKRHEPIITMRDLA